MNSLVHLLRLDKPIGIYLLLWPTLQAFVLANNKYNYDYTIFTTLVLATILIRSAGCVINDLWDREFDSNVLRTKDRVLAQKKIGISSAIATFIILSLLAFRLAVSLPNIPINYLLLTIFLVVIYPTAKRWFVCPQLILGLAFAQAVPIVFAICGQPLGIAGWLLYIATVIWALIYDTYYALVDINDDRKLGINSSAIAWGQYVKLVLLVLGLSYIFIFTVIGILEAAGIIYFISVGIVLGMILYAHMKLDVNNRDICFNLFKLSHWQGLVILGGFFVC